MQQNISFSSLFPRSIYIFILGFSLLISCKEKPDTTQDTTTKSESPIQAKEAPSNQPAPVTPKEVQVLPESKQEKAVRIVSGEQATIELFEQAAPSVCFINTSNITRDYYSRNVYEQPAGSGSGFIWDRDGHIVTNYHVIKGASKATVTLSDHTSYTASLVGVEPNKDLAVLKIDAKPSKLKPIKAGRSENLKVGQFVYAIGNPFGLDHTLTTGVISALGREIKSLTGRPIRDVIQTDAAINPGNSGGPLLDSQGALIGVNTQIYSPSGASAGIGFSIPVDEVNWVVPDLIKYGEVRRPVLGISLLPSQYAADFGVNTSLMIADVVVGGPADKAKLNPIRRSNNGRWSKGDVIKKLGSKSVTSYNDLILALEKYQPGETIDLVVNRNGKDLKKSIVLGESGK